MKRGRKFGQLCAGLLGLLACVESLAMMEADKFIGAWRLVSAEFRDENGAATESPYGSAPQGLLIYDAQGMMSAQLAQSGRKPFAIPDRMAGAPEEVRAAFETYQAYYGRFKIDEREHIVIHTVTQSLLPNWNGTEQRRHYQFKDGRLILRTPPLLIGAKRITGELIWEKVRLGKP